MRDVDFSPSWLGQGYLQGVGLFGPPIYTEDHAMRFAAVAMSTERLRNRTSMASDLPVGNVLTDRTAEPGADSRMAENSFLGSSGNRLPPAFLQN